VRHVSGEFPQLCVWEDGPNRCAPLHQPTVQGPNWTTYRASFTPDPSTTTLDLFLYAAAVTPHKLTVADYAQVRIVETPSIPELDVVSTPISPNPRPYLKKTFDGYSMGWQGASGDEHVLVNGLTNGWLLGAASKGPPRYAPETAVDIGFATAGAAAILDMAILALALRRTTLRRSRATTNAPFGGRRRN